MADGVVEKLAEAKRKMFGTLQTSGKILLVVKGNAEVKTSDPKVQITREG